MGEIRGVDWEYFKQRYGTVFWRRSSCDRTAQHFLSNGSNIVHTRHALGVMHDSMFGRLPQNTTQLVESVCIKGCAHKHEKLRVFSPESVLTYCLLNPRKQTRRRRLYYSDHFILAQRISNFQISCSDVTRI